jgi:hypothetical protein
MRALAYLLGARALDIAWDAGSAQRTPEVPLGPLATTPETVSAWRRWSEARESRGAVESATRGRQRLAPAKTEPSGSPA